MKRLIFVVFLLFALSACSAQGNAKAVKPELDVPFSAEAEITYGGEECTARIQRMESGRWEFAVTSPKALEGLIITVSDGETKLKMYDLESLSDVSDKAVSMAKALVSAYDCAAKDGEAMSDGGTLTVSGSSPFGEYKLMLGDDRSPVFFSVERCKLSADISRFAPLEREEEEFPDARIIE